MSLISATIFYTLILLLLLCVAEYELLCGNPAPGFIIDIHTGKPIGKTQKIVLKQDFI